MRQPRRFEFTSERTGRTYHLTPAEALAFYEAEIMGLVPYMKRKLEDRVVIVGSLLLQLFEPGGEMVAAHAAPNLVVDTGRGAVIDRMQGTSVGVWDYQALGTGATAAAAGDTALQTELTGGSNARVQGTLSQPTAYTDRLVSVFAAGNGTGAVTESGRLTASSAGVLVARQVFSAINKAAGDSLTTTHDLTV